MIAGVEGRHAWWPPGAAQAAATLGYVKDDAGAQVYPRVKLKSVSGGGLGDPTDVADPIIGTFGEVARPTNRRGKTRTYTGVIEALSLLDFETYRDELAAAMADQSPGGKMVVSWHPLYRQSPLHGDKVEYARAMGLEIGDPLESVYPFTGMFIAAFRNHDGRHFDTAEQSAARNIPVTGVAQAWPSVTLPASMAGPVLDVDTNAVTNPSGDDGTTTGYAQDGAANISTFDAIDLSASVIFEPIFDPPTDHALHVVTTGAAAAGTGAHWSKAVANGAPVRFVVWVRNRGLSATPINLTIRNAAGTVKATSAMSAPQSAIWTKLEVNVTPDATETWTFRIQQSGAGVHEWAFASVRITSVSGMTLEPGFGPRINFPANWDGQTLHFDFEALSILDDAGHDYGAIINPSFGVWKRNPWSAQTLNLNAVITTGGVNTNPDTDLTLRWTPAYF